MRPLSNAALLFRVRRDARTLAGRGVDLRQSTRHITVDGQTALLLADLLDLPADYVAEVFAGAPVGEAEGVASAAANLEGFRKVDYLFGYARRRGRIVSADSRVAAYEATRQGATA